MRTAIKSITWRFIATTITGTITYAATGQIDIAVKVLSADFFIKLAGFYIHEKLWEIKK